MALTTGSQGASATPAADFYTLLSTRLTAGGWTEETTRTYTAVMSGTTAACKVWVSYNTTNGSGTPVAGSSGNISSGIYTGAILIIETDETNGRVRFRVTEKFDSSLASRTALTGTTCVVATDVFTKTTHGLSVNDPVQLSNLSTLTGITAGQVYYVNTVPTASTFTISATVGGGNVNVGGTDGSCDVQPLTINCKWPAPGNSATGTMTPTANHALQLDAFTSIMHTASSTQWVGWVDMLTSGSGFNYWLGVNHDRWFFMSNSSAQFNVCMGGQLAYQGDLLTSVGNAAVWLLGNTLAVGSTNGSWTVATGGGGQAIVRCSREVGGGNFSQAGACCYAVSGPLVMTGTATTATNGATYGGPGANPAHRFYQGNMVCFPAWITSGDHGDMSDSRARGNLATIPEALVFIRPDATVNVLSSLTKALFPNIGELGTASGVTYTCTGQISCYAPTNTQGGGVSAAALWIDGSQFS